MFEEEKEYLLNWMLMQGTILLFVVKAGAEENGKEVKEKRTPQSPPKFNQ